MEIFDLSKLPKGVGAVQSFNPPSDIPFNNLAVIAAIVATLTALAGIGILWYTLVLYQRDHNLRVLEPGLIGGGFMLAMTLTGALLLLMDSATTRSSWLLRLDDQQLVADCGPAMVPIKQREWLPGARRAVAIPYAEIESARARYEQYYYPKTVSAGDDLDTEIRKIVCPTLELRLKNPAPPALQQALADGAAIRQELAARSLSNLNLTPFYVTIRLTDDQKTIRINWDSALSPNLEQALAILGKHLPVQPEEHADVLPATPFANTPAAWKELDVPRVNDYAGFLVEQGYSDSAGQLLWQLVEVDNGDYQGKLRQLMVSRDPAKGRTSFGDAIRQYLAAVKWSPFVLPIALVLIGIGLLDIYVNYRCWQVGNQTRNWVATQGVITTSLKSPDNREPNIVYRYSVNGKELQGRTITLTPYRGRAYHPSRLLESYPVDREVTVHYNPEQPDQAVLDHVSPSSLATLLLGQVASPFQAVTLLGLVALLLGPFFV